MHRLKNISLLIASFYMLACNLIIVFPSCRQYTKNKSHSNISNSSIESGKELAVKYCQSCHLLPEPSLLDSKSWANGVLPQMGPRLGIFYYGTESYPSGKYDRNLDRDFYPSQPLLKYEEWQNIIDYYTATSPDTIIASGNSKPPIKNSLSLFSAIIPKFSYSTPATAVVKIDESQREHQLVISDVPKQTVYRLNKNLEKVDSIRTHGPVVDIEIHGKEWLACNVGVLNPNNGKFGKAEYIQIKKDGKLNDSTITLFEKLVRPVQITSADLNKDGREDYILCEFGYYQGSLSWMENLGKSQLKNTYLDLCRSNQGVHTGL